MPTNGLSSRAVTIMKLEKESSQQSNSWKRKARKNTSSGSIGMKVTSQPSTSTRPSLMAATRS